MNGEERKNTRKKNENWENELWSLINNYDGVNCPLQKQCQYKNNPEFCLNKDKDYTDSLHRYLDNDFLVIPPPFQDFPKYPGCLVNSQLFVLVTRLARKYARKITPGTLPVPMEIIPDFCPEQPIEVRLVSLKSAHGAVWHLNDAWVIHLNSNDSSARKRFTFFHEVFHILAHCNARPVFKKSTDQYYGDFNELLADFFSGMMILPYKLMRKKWQEMRDIKNMAVYFDVPEPVIYCGLKWMKLI